MTVSKQKRPYFGLTGKWLTYWITFACSVDMLLFGYDQASFSGVIVTDNFLELHDLVGPEKTQMLSTVTAIYDIGCFVGAVVAFTIGERLGRTKSIIVGTMIMSVGAILMCSSFSLAQMFVGRIVLGIGNGINTSTAPIWQTETAPAHWRGKLVMFEMMMNIAGFSLCNWINYGLSFAGGAVAWRFPLAFQFIFIIALFATVPWLPESPRWLMSHEHEAKATKVLACLEAKPEDDAFVVLQRDEIRFSINYEREHQIRWRDLLRPQPEATKPLRRLILGAGTQFIQQFEVNSVTYLIFSCVSVTLVEKWGRRGLMLISTTGQGLAFLVITILLRFGEAGGNRKAAEGSIVFFFLYYIAFGLGMLGILWLYPTEINSIAMRTKGAAVATATNWITNYVIVQITPIGIQNLGWKFWIVFTVLNAAFLPIIYLFYPETADRTLEDLDEYYRNNPPLVVIGDKDAVASKRPQKYFDHEEAQMERFVHEDGVIDVANKKASHSEAHHVE
ncbi:Sugar transporter STL1 [Diaporthe amygdali]|uniref:Sugar transporter STL1 n=1 Tax=Phomopsis amygdali TaxID=1214568 RepID=UPI0022FF1D0D|nr:Sugar transporter STL1 [Diaporthe amygdali]KAJ0120034.1 Sugar transporter STL1 [Diaporthe amygdali]